MVLSRGAAPAVSGPIGNVGTRSDGLPAAVPLSGTNMNEVQENNLPTQSTPQQAAQTDKPAVTQVSHDEMKQINEQARTGVSHITTTVVNTKPDGTRNPFFDAGGPYGGPDCFEGSCTIHFVATTDDPTIIFYRWDLNNDGAWDTPWSTDNFYDKLFLDNYYGLIKAEGWDGISTKTYIITGDNLNQGTSVYWYIWPLNTGWKFRAKVDMDATELGQYQWWTTFPGLNLRLWDFTSGAELGRCTPSTQDYYSWNWCTLGAPVHFTLGHEYMISEHMDYDYGYYTGMNNPPVSWDKVEYQDFWYAWGDPQRMPDNDNGGGTQFVPMIDFRWRQVLIIPLTQQAEASLDVNNVAPEPFGIMTNPSLAYEGTATKFSAWFNDPGTEDSWMFRWYFGDGTWSSWRNVNKFSGGAKVLIYHSASGDMDSFQQKIIDTCGSFCISVDAYDWGPLGYDKLATLDYLLQYDVIYLAGNYFPVGVSFANLGNQMADYVDQKGSDGAGGVVFDGFYTGGCWPTEITGRWKTDGYSPLNRGSCIYYNTVNLGTIYVPGHPILDGVTTLSSSFVHAATYSAASGATRVVDWTDGTVLAATKADPIVNNGAQVVGLNFFAPWYECGGGCAQIVVNSLKWASRQPAPVPLTMPIQLPWESHIYKDDDPVTTSPQDDINVLVQVKDDDHLKVEGTTTLVSTEGFDNDCNYYSFPAGWVNEPYWGWVCYYSGELGSNAANYWYYFNDYAESLLTGPSNDLTGYNAAKLEWRQYWWANYGGATQDGYVEVSTDGGLTFPYVIKEFHHNQPGGPETKTYIADIPYVSDNVVVRFRMESNYDWAWIVDDIKMYGLEGRLVWGLSEASGITTIANVPPTVVGGPVSGLRDEAQDFSIEGMQISDPAILEPTEWFAYKTDFDDGTPSEWIYKGTLAPPKQDILIIHSQCYPGNSCGELMNVVNMLNGLDLVGSVTTYNFFDSLSAPSLSYMLDFDVIMFASNWAYISYPPFDAARIAIGNNMAAYLDAGRGGVVTWMATYDLSPYYGEIFSLLGRYIDDMYGPFQKEVYPFGDGQMGTIHYPDHPVMTGVTDVVSNVIHSGNQLTNPGGIRLASFSDGGAFVGVKEIDSGMRSCAINAYTGGYGGNDAAKLLRQCIGWAIGGIPTPEIPPVVHNWGDNGLYNVDITLIDDDMGWTWDFVNNEPLADPAYTQELSHHYIPVEVNNVDPTIGGSGGTAGIAAYTASQLCVRLSGNKGNDVTLTVMGTDGSYYSVTTTRVPGTPAIGCLPKVTVDMTPDTEYTLTIAYDPTGDSGANPEWVFDSTWPDGKIKELRHTFNSNDGPSVWTIDNKEFKRLMLAGEITFEATATDPGSDDLAFAWIWGDSTPYDIHIYAHPGVFYTSASSDMFNLLPFKELKFVKADNSIRSPEFDPMRAHDTAKHTFDQSQMPYFLYVTLIVMDDDVTNPYPSTFHYPGMDMEVVPIGA